LSSVSRVKNALWDGNDAVTSKATGSRIRLYTTKLDYFHQIQFCSEEGAVRWFKRDGLWTGAVGVCSTELGLAGVGHDKTRNYFLYTHLICLASARKTSE
jgi:hypothetical protein